MHKRFPLEKTDVETRYLTTKEVSQLTGIAIPTLCNARHRSEGIPYVKVSRSVRYLLADVLEYMENRRVATGGDR